MTDQAIKAGTIGWMDLSVPDAVAIRDFYAAVVGWKIEPVDMHGYDDFCMVPAAGATPAAGICHARGENADLPPYWLAYVVVDDLDASLKSCVERGGKVIRAPTGDDSCGAFGVIQDPAGAYLALMEAETELAATDGE